MSRIAQRQILVDGLVTGYLEAGQGDPVVLLHGGEFGASAEIGWEHIIGALAGSTGCWRPTCWASANPRRLSTSSTAAACGSGTSPGSARCSASTSAHFVGNSMGAVNLLADVDVRVTRCCPSAAW